MKKRAALIAACIAFGAMFAVAGCSEEDQKDAPIVAPSEPMTLQGQEPINPDSATIKVPGEDY